MGFCKYLLNDRVGLADNERWATTMKIA